MGDLEVKDMMGYMKGLSMYEKGDSTTVQVKREKTTLDIPIIFQ